MPAPRNCRACGAALPAQVRWCGQCYEPVRELTPRAPLHDGDFADHLIPQGPNAPHWSRTRRSATTFGLRGRIVLTMLFVIGVLVAASTGYFIYVIVAPVVGIAFLGAVWGKGWVIPDERRLPALPDAGWPEQAPAQPLTAAMWIWRVLWMALALAGVVVVAYGSQEARLAAFSVVALLGMWWFIRGFLTR